MHKLTAAGRLAGVLLALLMLIVILAPGRAASIPAVAGVGAPAYQGPESGAVPGPAPLMPARPLGLNQITTAPAAAAPAAGPCRDTHCTYLPQVNRIVPPPPAKWINADARQDVAAAYLAEFGADTPGIGWTGSRSTCTPGTTGQAFRDAILRRVNFFRALAGVPAQVQFSADSNAKAQAAALMMSVNRALSHDPPPSWTCYSDAGHAGAGSANLFLGVDGPDAITGYMEDPGDGNSAAGHRRWILYPQTQIMGTGDIPSSDGYPPTNALVVFDSHTWEARPATRDPFVAWPPQGYVPYRLVTPRWSFAVAGADFSHAQVTVRQGGATLPVSLEPVANGYGENTLVFRPQGPSWWGGWPRPSSDTPYHVNVTGVQVSGHDQSYSYQVIVFDPGS